MPKKNKTISCCTHLCTVIIHRIEYVLAARKYICQWNYWTFTIIVAALGSILW